MEEIKFSNISENIFENVRHEILCEDIIKKLRPAIEQYGVEMRQFIRTSMIRGFSRNIIIHSIAVFQTEIMNFVAMAEDSLVLSNSPKTKILEGELQLLKTSIGVFVKTSEKILLEKPEIDNQLFFDNNGRIA